MTDISDNILYAEEINEFLICLAARYGFEYAILTWKMNGYWYTPFIYDDERCEIVSAKKNKTVLPEPRPDFNYSIEMPGSVNFYGYLREPTGDCRELEAARNSLIFAARYLVQKHNYARLTKNLGREIYENLNEILNKMMNTETKLNKYGMLLSSNVFNYIDSLAAGADDHSVVSVDIENMFGKIIEIMKNIGAGKISYYIEPGVPKIIALNEKITQQIIINFILLALKFDGDVCEIYVYQETHEIDARATEIIINVLHSYSEDTDLFDLRLSACYALAKKLNYRIIIQHNSASLGLCITI